jgi:type IV pilus assembly protein PilB
VAGGVVDSDTVQEALAAQAALGGKLGEVLVREFGVNEEAIACMLAEQKGLEYARLAEYGIDREAAAQIPVEFARAQRVIPVGFEDGTIVVAMADPLDIETMDEIRLMTELPVAALVATSSDIAYAIEKHMASADAIFEMPEDAHPGDEEEDADAGEEDVPIVRLVNQVVREAVMERASDVHIEPGEDGVQVRFRIDGVLQNVVQLPRNARAGVTSRVKIMAELDIAERRLPQDGRTSVIVDGEAIDLRIATLPTPYGEAVTIRILHEGLTFRKLEDLGMAEHHLEIVRELLEKPYGAVLSAGPTGSGKSTTLYAALNLINDPSRKIITVEDPVEYRLPGLTQTAARPKIGLTFATGLRSILRSDPDVVMIGEMRDPETAQIGVRAALTGHLVLSSIHTNDAPSALTRLVDMEVPPFIVSSALIGVIAQRLARRLCPDCKEQAPVTDEQLERAGFDLAEDGSPQVFRAVGCERCASTGYRGRIGLFEVMAMSDELSRLLLAQAPIEEFRAAALEQGMRSIRDDALAKVAAGITSLEEVARVAM